MQFAMGSVDRIQIYAGHVCLLCDVVFQTSVRREGWRYSLGC